MIDYSDLSRLIAKHVLGWRVFDQHYGIPFHARTPQSYPTIEDPCVWGSLMVMMSNNGSVSLSFIEDQDIWISTIHREPSIFIGRSHKHYPGRAIAIAVLRAYQVEHIDQYEDV